jgi:hypothetical protein
MIRFLLKVTLNCLFDSFRICYRGFRRLIGYSKEFKKWELIFLECFLENHEAVFVGIFFRSQIHNLSRKPISWHHEGVDVLLVDFIGRRVCSKEGLGPLDLALKGLNIGIAHSLFTLSELTYTFLLHGL